MGSILIVSNSLSIFKTATLTPINPSDNGANITLSGGTNIYNNAWELYDGTDNIGVQLILTLDSSWGFHSNQVSTLILEVNADTNTQIDYGYHDLVVAFTQSPYTSSYFATRISMDLSDDHAMYPDTSWTQPTYPSSYANGDVQAWIDCVCNGYDRWVKVTKNTNTFDWYLPAEPVGSRSVTSPLTFTLENHPKANYMTYSYWNPGASSRSCGYAALQGDKGMKVYFAGSWVYDSIDIASITVTLTYNITDNPTVIPTIDPTSNPTLDPTVTTHPTSDPTIIPTKQPSSLPSVLPSIDPTNDPTLDPTLYPTIQPSNIPSFSPSKMPSFTPTEITSNPSISPTMRPTNNPSDPQGNVEESTSFEENGGVDFNGNESEKQNNNDNTLYMVIGSIIGGFLLIVVVLCIVFTKRKKTAIMKQEQLAKMNSISQSSANSPQADGNKITEMVIKTDIDLNDNDDGIYDNVGSVDSNKIITPRSDANSMLNTTFDENEEGADDKETEKMYEVMVRQETAGNVVTNKGDNESDSDDEIDQIYDTKKIETIQTPTNGDDNTKNGDDKELQEWLRSTVELPQYYDIFVQNGLDSLDLVKKIDDDGLIALGVGLKGHRIILLKYMKELNVVEGNV